MAKYKIIISKFLDKEYKPSIGGVESYLSALCELIISIGSNVTIYQFADKDFVKTIDVWKKKVNIFGVGKAQNGLDIINYINKYDSPDYENDVIIFATEYVIAKNKYKKSIAIQHGIAWDSTKEKKVGITGNILCALKDSFRAINKYLRYKNCSDLVCVDYNFLNWYRTQVDNLNTNIHVIPNFAHILKQKESINEEKNSVHVSIVFARRLVDYRGTKLFTYAIKKVLNERDDIDITVAGVGPDEGWMKKELAGYNVVFTSYSYEDSVSFHSNFDIAVVPTKWSEGTSLSLLEAMSAGCAVIATNVGGMTNIILDRFNGLLIDPDVKELETAFLYLIDNKDKREMIAKNAQETIKQSFSYDIWKEKWKKVLNNI